MDGLIILMDTANFYHYSLKRSLSQHRKSKWLLRSPEVIDNHNSKPVLSHLHNCVGNPSVPRTHEDTLYLLSTPRDCILGSVFENLGRQFTCFLDAPIIFFVFLIYVVQCLIRFVGLICT